MLQDNVPKNMPPIPGIIPLINRAEVFNADDEQGFTFDIDNCVIYWMKNPVDMMRICDPCLIDVHRAACTDTRFVELNHLDAAVRKVELRHLRDREQLRAELVAKLELERTRRRARDFANRALQTYRRGVVQEEYERQQELLTQKVTLATEEARRQKKKLVKEAVSADKKWRKQDAAADKVQMKGLLDKVEVMYRAPYTLANPVSAKRENPYSWELASYNDKGLPADREAAAAFFSGESKAVTTGTGGDDLKPLLQTWKRDAADVQAEVLELRREKNRREKARREKERQELLAAADLVDIVKERNDIIKKRHADLAEEERLRKRREDRTENRKRKVAAMEKKNREEMLVEDFRSHRHEFYMWEQQRLRCEREGMLAAEKEQTRVDSFWGIPTEIRRLKEEERRRRREFEARVKLMREVCIQVGVTRPFTWEHGEFRDRVTNKIIK